MVDVVHAAPGVAATAACGEVVGVVGAACRFGFDVVDGVGWLVAEVAGPVIAGEDGEAQGSPVCAVAAGVGGWIDHQVQCCTGCLWWTV